VNEHHYIIKVLQLLPVYKNELKEPTQACIVNDIQPEALFHYINTLFCLISYQGAFKDKYFLPKFPFFLSQSLELVLMIKNFTTNDFLFISIEVKKYFMEKLNKFLEKFLSFHLWIWYLKLLALSKYFTEFWIIECSVWGQSISFLRCSIIIYHTRCYRRIDFTKDLCWCRIHWFRYFQISFCL